MIVERNLGSPPCTPEDYRIVDGEFIPPVRVAVRRTQAETDDAMARLGIDASVTWDDRHGCHRIEPGPSVTTADIEALGREFQGAYAVLDQGCPAGRDRLDELVRAFEASPPHDALEADEPGPAP